MKAAERFFQGPLSRRSVTVETLSRCVNLGSALWAVLSTELAWFTVCLLPGHLLFLLMAIPSRVGMIGSQTHPEEDPIWQKATIAQVSFSGLSCRQLGQ